MLALVSLTFVALDVRSGKSSPFGPIRSAGTAVIGPIERAIGGVVNPIGSFFGDIGDLGRYKGKADKLARENQALQAQLRASARVRARADELEKLLALAGRGGYRIVAAQVDAVASALGAQWTATVSAGSKDGIRPDMTVVNGDGLVGRVSAVSTYTSTVVLAVDNDFSVGVRVESTAQIGTVTGQGEGRPFAFTSLGANPALKVGQRLVTLGPPTSSYAAEVPVGYVTKVEATRGGLQVRAQVAPYVSFSSLDAVSIIVAVPVRPPADSVLPPKPTPAAPSPAAPATSPAPGPSVAPSASTNTTASSTHTPTARASRATSRRVTASPSGRRTSTATASASPARRSPLGTPSSAASSRSPAPSAS